MAITTIQLESKTRKRLAGLKRHPRESYDEIINKLMELIPDGDEEGKFSDAFRADLLEAHLDSIHGRTIPHEEVKKLLGL